MGSCGEVGKAGLLWGQLCVCLPDDARVSPGLSPGSALSLFALTHARNATFRTRAVKYSLRMRVRVSVLYLPEHALEKADKLSLCAAETVWRKPGLILWEF